MENLIKERPILFAASMVRALLADTKTQARQIVKGIDIQEGQILGTVTFLQDKGPNRYTYGANVPIAELTNPFSGIGALCPYGQPGDRLWVRETCRFKQFSGSVGMMHGRTKPWQYMPHDIAKHWPGDYESRADEAYPQFSSGWTSSTNMPRVACRILLEVVSVRVERLLDISEEDAQAEGATQGILRPYGTSDWQLEHNIHSTYKEGFQYEWYKANSAQSWFQNPWVWVVKFKRVQL